MIPHPTEEILLASAFAPLVACVLLYLGGKYCYEQNHIYAKRTMAILGVLILADSVSAFVQYINITRNPPLLLYVWKYTVWRRFLWLGLGFYYWLEGRRKAGLKPYAFEMKLWKWKLWLRDAFKSSRAALKKKTNETKIGRALRRCDACVSAKQISRICPLAGVSLLCPITRMSVVSARPEKGVFGEHTVAKRFSMYRKTNRQSNKRAA